MADRPWRAGTAPLRKRLEHLERLGLMPVSWREQLEREGDGKIEIVVHRAVEVALWSQAIELSHAGFFHQLLAAGDDPDDDRADPPPWNAASPAATLAKKGSA